MPRAPSPLKPPSLLQTETLTGPLIIGAGLAGLSAALAAAPVPVTVIVPETLGEHCSSAWAQGGLAAALSAYDSPEAHAADTVAAGAGLVEPDMALALTRTGRETVEGLAALGAPFDRDADGGFALSREAAHSLARVARVGGDQAGKEILRAVIAAVRASPHIRVLEHSRARHLLTGPDGRVTGAVIDREGTHLALLAPAVILATGGIGGLYAMTTNPAALTGDGLALAALAGAEILDPEFVQFHPTAMDVGLDPAPLATEALRGDGAVLIDAKGVRFALEDHPDGELAPRDIVARAVFKAATSGRGAFLDARTAVGEHFPEAFPAVFAACLRAGIDPRVQPIPVAPAEHYHMGGIRADTEGRTSVPGLYAIGECAATGVHGANRLASNSLLEAAAFGARSGRAAAQETAAPAHPGRIPCPALTPDLPHAALQTLRRTLSHKAGVVRDSEGLREALAMVEALEQHHGLALPLITARFILTGALNRCETRGAHFRTDFPETDADPRHTRLTLADLTTSSLPSVLIAAE
ncbi:MAG: L-aspartate oxidase [Asticcacaulis sp.]